MATAEATSEGNTAAVETKVSAPKYNFIFKEYEDKKGIFLFFDKSINLSTKDTIDTNLSVTTLRENTEDNYSVGGSLIKNFCKSCLFYFIDNMVPGYFIKGYTKDELKIDISNLNIEDPESIDIKDTTNTSIFTAFRGGLAVNPLKESIKNYGRILKEGTRDTNSNYMKSNIGYLNDNIFLNDKEKNTIEKQPDFSKLKNTDLKTVVEKYFTDEGIITTDGNNGKIFIGIYEGEFKPSAKITLTPFNSKPSTFQSKFYLKTSNTTLNKLTGTIDGNTITFDSAVLTDPTKEQTLDSEGSQIEQIFGTKGGSIKQNNYSIKQKKNQNKFTKKNNKINKRNGIHFQ